jgi:hypothetical protein
MLGEWIDHGNKWESICEQGCGEFVATARWNVYADEAVELLPGYGEAREALASKARLLLRHWPPHWTETGPTPDEAMRAIIKRVSNWGYFDDVPGPFWRWPWGELYPKAFDRGQTWRLSMKNWPTPLSVTP